MNVREALGSLKTISLVLKSSGDDHDILKLRWVGKRRNYRLDNYDLELPTSRPPFRRHAELA